MKILQLQAENFKRLKVVSITPEGHLVQISGRNGQGKTSVLDSIEAAIGGADGVCAKPVRVGTEKSRTVIRFDDGLVVRRTFTAGGGTTLVVEKDGARYMSPQKILDDLVGKLTFDPLAFTRMDSRKQLEALRKLVGLDFAEADRLRKDLYENRTEINREIKLLQSQIAGMPSHPDAPAQEVSIADLSNEFERRRKVNAENERRRAQCQRATEELFAATELVKSAEQVLLDSDTVLVAALAMAEEDLKEQIEKLRQQHEVRREQIKADHLRGSKRVAQQRSAAIDTEWGCKAEIQALARAIAADLDTAEVQQAMAGAEAANRKFHDNQRWTRAVESLDAVHRKAEALSAQIEQIDGQKQAALASAKFPVPGLSFDDSGVTYNGIPFEQASSAEQLRVSAAIGLSSNPKLRVLLIRDGSLLDAQGMKLLAEIAEAHSAQVWVERVADDATTGVIIEDGEVAGGSVEPEVGAEAHEVAH